MTINGEQDAIRSVRDDLIAALAKLDRLDIRMAAIEVNAAVEILNTLLGEATSSADIEALLRRHFSN